MNNQGLEKRNVVMKLAKTALSLNLFQPATSAKPKFNPCKKITKKKINEVMQSGTAIKRHSYHFLCKHQQHQCTSHLHRPRIVQTMDKANSVKMSNKRNEKESVVFH